jgi:2,3-bisphosphoglycerate-independent phosphoglycerate mutase
VVKKDKKTVLLAILDGWGYTKETFGNPVAEAKTPLMDQIRQNYPMVLLQASGTAVGMSWGESGNSEVGHLNMGAGRVIRQYCAKINDAIQDESFFSNSALVSAFQHAKENQSKVHIIGLLTSSTVHASFNHLLALVKMAAVMDHPETYFHLFLDGRDCGFKEGYDLVNKTQEEIKKQGRGKIATIIGRHYSMDRSNDWERTKIGFDLIASAKGEKTENLLESIKKHYQEGSFDPTITPLINAEADYHGLSNNDSLIFFNFREDSIRQIFRAFCEKEFTFFERPSFTNLQIVTMTKYLDDQTQPVAFLIPEVSKTLGEVLEQAGKTQLHIAETDKYAHVTYFFNGLKNKPFGGEDDIFVKSKENIIENPEMGSQEIAEKIVEVLDKNIYDFIILNFANPDLLAHLGDYRATVAGVEAVDSALLKITQKALAQDAILLITADHGNAESLVGQKGGEPETAHDDNPVFLFLVGNQFKKQKSDQEMVAETAEIRGILADIAPTVLELMDLPTPPEITGQSLLKLLN